MWMKQVCGELIDGTDKQLSAIKDIVYVMDVTSRSNIQI